GSPDMRLKADLTATAVNRETVRQLVQSIVRDVDFAAGVPELTAKVDAPLYHPLAGTGQAHVVMTDATLDGETLFNSFSGTVQGTTKGWSTDDLTATLATLTVGAKVEHRRVGAFNLAAAETKGAGLATRLGLSPHDHLTAALKTTEEKPAADAA